MGKKSRVPYTIAPHRAELAPGIDPDRLNQLVDTLEDDELIRKLKR